MVVTIWTFASCGDKILLVFDSWNNGRSKASEDSSQYADSYIDEFVHGYDCRK